MGLLQKQSNPKSLLLNVSCFIHLLHQCLEGWWNVGSVETVVIFSQTHCLYGILTGLQGGPKPCCTTSQIISVVYLTPKRGKWNITIFVGYEDGEEQTCASGMAGRQWPELGYSFQRSDFIPQCCAPTSELQGCISFIFLQVKERWHQLRDSWGKRAPKPNKYCWL